MITLWLTAGLSFGTALLLATTGAISLRRPVLPAARSALHGFALWWFATAALLALIGLRTVLYLAGVQDLQVYLLLRTAIAFPLALALPGLLYYLIFIYTGRRSALPLLFIAYSLFLGFALYYFSLNDIDRIEATTWSVRTVGDDRAPAGLTATFGLLVAGPILAAIVAYASLYRRVAEPEQRYRIALVSIAFGLWFLPLLIAFVVGWNRADWFPLVYQVPGVFAAILVLVAYRPPRALRQQWLQPAIVADAPR